VSPASQVSQTVSIPEDLFGMLLKDKTTLPLNTDSSYSKALSSSPSATFTSNASESKFLSRDRPPLVRTESFLEDLKTLNSKEIPDTPLCSVHGKPALLRRTRKPGPERGLVHFLCSVSEDPCDFKQLYAQ